MTEKSIEVIKDLLLGLNRSEIKEVKTYFDGYCEAIGYKRVKDWESLNPKSEQIKKDVLDRIKDHKGISKTEFNSEEQKALLLLLAEGMIYEQETDEYACVYACV